MRIIRPALLALAIAGGFFYFTTWRSNSSNIFHSGDWLSHPANVEITEAAGNEGLDSEEQNNILVYRKNIPSVVNVTSRAMAFDFFNGLVPQEGQGSGFVIDKDGHILTNYHVVADARQVEVTLHNRKKYKATVIGTDPAHDLAVIQIKAPELIPAVLGDSRNLQVGQKVYAIGNPFGLAGTMTRGIVSSIRPVREPNGATIEEAIQTDAAINPGNSGGPLVDMAGQVVGMNTAIYTQSMGSQGVGFAMPANTIASVYNMLIGPEHKVVRGSIGIQFQVAQSSAVGRVYGFSNGVIVGVVTPNGGAAKAGMQAGDVIVSIDGRNIKDGDDLVADISARRVGSTVKLGYLRDGKQEVANVVIGDRAKTYASIAGEDDETPTPDEPDAGQGKLGITVTAIPPPVAAKIGTKSGVMVTSVRPGSFADEIGLTKTAVITAINKKPVTDEASYRAIVATLKSKDDVVFVIQSPSQKGFNSYVGGTLP